MYSITHPDRSAAGGPQTAPGRSAASGSGPARARRDAARRHLATVHQAQDSDVVARLRSGDLPALDILWDRYARAVYVRCWRVLRERQAAWDATQDTFLAFLAHLHCGCGQPVHEWLFATCVRIAADHPSTRERA